MNYDTRADHHSPEYDPEVFEGLDAPEPDEDDFDDKYSNLSPEDDIWDNEKEKI